jgi:hypothetical protein
MDIPFATVIDYTGGAHITAGLPEERSVLTDAARDTLPAGTITIDADECTAVAAGDGTFMDTGLGGRFPGSASVALPAFIVAGPGLPLLIPGGSTSLIDQKAVNSAQCDFRAVDVQGVLFRWDDAADGSGFGWEKAGTADRDVTPVFPVMAWRQ